jgi:nucleotide-binding universal stress UspA family protein
VEKFVLESLAGCGLVKTEVLVDDVIGGLVAYANQNGIDLIVMGTHCKGVWYRLFHGSIGESVLEKANCPVLLVPIRD